MKKAQLLIIAIISLITLSFTSSEENLSIYDYEINDITGQKIELSKFKGKKLLLVNVASKCGFTPQYEALQKLHETHGDKLVIIGFPCNQFMNQEPGTATEIVEFCKKNYGVEFLITEKIDVKGKAQHPIYSWLTNKTLNSKMDSKVKWNFQKYLIDENGNLIDVFASNIDPLDKIITDKI